MSILRAKYSGVEFATGDTRTHMLYKGAPTCQWKNICKHVKRRPAKERLTTIWFNGPIFGLGLNEHEFDSFISHRPRTTAITYILLKCLLNKTMQLILYG